MRKVIHPAFLLLLSAFLMLPAQADEKKAGREQARRMQQLQRKLQEAEQDRDQLATEKKTLEGQAKDAQAKLAQSKRESAASASRVAALKQDLDAAQADKTALAAKLADTEHKLADAADRLRAADNDKSMLTAKNTREMQAISSCQDHNARLHDLGMELLDKYSRKSCSDAMLQAEPFTGLKRVQIESLVEDYRGKLDDQKLPPAAAARPGGGS